MAYFHPDESIAIHYPCATRQDGHRSKGRTPPFLPPSAPPRRDSADLDPAGGRYPRGREQYVFLPKRRDLLAGRQPSPCLQKRPFLFFTLQPKKDPDPQHLLQCQRPTGFLFRSARDQECKDLPPKPAIGIQSPRPARGRDREEDAPHRAFLRRRPA